MAAFKACSHQKVSLSVCQAFCASSLMASSQLNCAQELEAHLAQPSVTDWAVLLVGYFVLGCLAMAGLWLYLAWRVVRSGRRGRGLAWAKHALSMAGRQFRGHLIRLGFGAKVSTVISSLHSASTFNALLPLPCALIVDCLPWLPENLLLSGYLQSNNGEQ
jgi:hypothetical protein